MYHRNHLGLSWTVKTIFAVAFFILLYFWLMPTAYASSVFAQSSTTPGSITVVGEGKVTIEPDIARANIGIEVVKPTVAEASTESKALIQTILAVLEEQGIAENDIQTSGFNISADRYGPGGPLADDEVQYRVNNTVLVIIRDLDQVGDILDAAIEAGANNIYGISFQIEDPSRVSSKARESAVADARAKAEELANLTGTTLGNVVSISEIVGGNGGYYQSNFQESSASLLGGGGGNAFAPGELNLVMRLQVAYAIASTDSHTADIEEPTVVEIDELMTLYIAPETAECVGVAPQTCLQVKSDKNDKWSLFYDQIDGFDYEPGFGYELIVSLTQIENPPADGSSIHYQLVQLVEKIDMSDEESAEKSDDTE